MGSIQRLIHPISSENALEVLATSMWSTMLVTGFLFMSCLSVYLSVKVTNSVKTETVDVGPMNMSFVFSVSGIRYFVNHIRHHLFETPLLPRRRFSSMSVFWIPRILKRLSFSSRRSDFSNIETEIPNFEKGRRNSTQPEGFGIRRNSTSKAKRQSVPQIYNPTLKNGSNPVSISENSTQTSSTKNILPTRRSTLPVLSISSNLTDPKETEISSPVKPILDLPSQVEPLKPNFENRISLDPIVEEEQEVDKPSPIIETVIEEPVAEVEETQVETMFGSSSEFGDIISEASETVSTEVEVETEAEVEKIQTQVSKSIDIKQKQPEAQSKFESSSPKSQSYRYSYFNYLPESIFGYSITSTKAPETQTSEITGTPPPGFTKRSMSHDYTNSSIQSQQQPDLNNEFNNHQPLYARRRTETFKRLTESARSYIPFNAPSFNFQPFESKSEENLASSKQPSRSNSSSPCLVDLQNTDDLFAPINWSYSNVDQTESLRKSWDTINEEEDEVIDSPEPSVASPRPIGSGMRRKSSAYSLFGGY